MLPKGLDHTLCLSGEAIVPDYVGKLFPRQCQIEALAAIEGKSAFALHMAMRTGKSKVIIDDFGRLEVNDQIDDLLIIATGGSYRTWEVQLKEHAAQSLLDRLITFIWDSRKLKSKVKLDELKAFEISAANNKPRCLIINIEALSTVKLAKALCERFVQARRCMVAVDESTSIRNPKSKRTNYVVGKIGPRAKYRRTLTGLPNPKSPLDLFSQFEFLDRNIIGFDTYAAFKERYADEERICMVPKNILISKLRKEAGDYIVKEGFGRFAIADMKQQELLKELSERKIWVPTIPRIKGFKNQEELRDKIAPYVYRKRLEDCYDLPPKIFIKREVQMPDDQRKAYEEMQAFFTTQLATSEHVTAANVITCMLKLHQILCGHVKDESGVVREVSTNRISSLIELLDEYDGKAIVWCSYDHDVQAISEKLGSTAARFWGGNKNTREEEEKRFLNDDDCRYMVATAAAGGKGRTWINADLVVYYSNSHDLEHRVQSEERTQGVGKTNSVAYVDMIVPDTVDERILFALKHKWTLASVINGDNWKEWIV